MVLQVKIEDGRGSGLLAHVHSMGVSGGHTGILTLQERLLKFVPDIIPFLNPSFGNAMNQNISFSGSPELIFDGAGGGWTDTSTSGSEWNLTDSGKVTLTNGGNNNFAIFEDSVAPVDSDGFTALSGKIDLDNYTPGSQDLLLNFSLSGSPVGSSLGINAYIDTGEFNEQSFIIPIDDFNLGGSDIDGLTITVQRSGGPQLTIKFDDFQLEQIGTPAVFKIFANEDANFHVKKVRFVFTDAFTGIVTGSTTTYPTMPGLSYNKILGLSALANGILVQIVIDGKVSTSATLRQLSDLIGIGADIVSLVGDGTDSMLILELEFSEPIFLKRNDEAENYISVTISDDLSGLIGFTGVARGAYEV